MCREGIVINRGEREPLSNDRSRNGHSLISCGSMFVNFDGCRSCVGFLASEYGSVGELEPKRGDKVPFTGDRALESFGVPAPDDSIKIV